MIHGAMLLAVRQINLTKSKIWKKTRKSKSSQKAACHAMKLHIQNQNMHSFRIHVNHGKIKALFLYTKCHSLKHNVRTILVNRRTKDQLVSIQLGFFSFLFFLVAFISCDRLRDSWSNALLRPWEDTGGII